MKENIAEEIKRSGYSQTHIANVIGVTQSCIAHYIKADILPSLDVFIRLCKLLDLDVNEVLGLNK